MRTSNPVLNPSVFNNAIATTADEGAMTIQGAVNKTVILLGLALITAAWSWHLFISQSTGATPAAGAQAVIPWLIGGAIGGLIFGLVTSFKPVWAGVTAPLYALCEGLFLGGISAFFETRYPGIVLPAIGLTFGTVFCMLMAYKLGLVRATEKFKLGVIAATGAIALVYLVSMLLSFFGVGVPMIHSAGPIGIGFSVVVVVIAALNLVLDFDLIETAADRGAPRYMEWYGAFALMVTLVWLYLEILRLLSKLRKD